MNALQYMKNVGKSFGYATIEVLGNNNPVVKESLSSAKELSTELYQSIKDFRDSFKNQMDKSEKSFIGETKDVLKSTWTAAKSDIMTGKLYNKERIKQSESEMASLMLGFDMDDFGDFDFSFDDDDDSSSSDFSFSAESDREVEVQIKSTQAITSTMDTVAAKSVGAITKTNVKTAEYIVAAQERASKALYDLTGRGFNQLSTGIGAVNSNMNVLVSLAEPLTSHMQNSATFYARSTEYQQKSLELLQRIADNTGPAKNKAVSRNTEFTIDDLVSGGVFDARQYAKMVKKNIKDELDMYTSLFELGGGIKGMASMTKLSTSPFALLLTPMINAMMGKDLKKSMKNFNEMLDGSLKTFLGTLGDRDFGIFDFFKDLFLPRSTRRDSKLKTGDYEKGRVDWDGVSRKALTEVIPRQLSEIISLLSGNEVKTYDYSSGTWKTTSTIKNEWRDREVQAARSASGDLYYSSSKVLSSLRNSNMISDKRQKEMNNQIEEFLRIALLSGDSDFINFDKDNFNYAKYGLDKQTWRILKAISDKAKSTGNTAFKTNFTGSMFSGRDKFGYDMDELNADGTHVANILFDNSNIKNKSRMLLGTDSYNNDVFYYLQGIYLHTKHVSDNLPLLISGGGKTGTKIKGASIKNNAKSYKAISTLTIKEDRSNTVSDRVSSKGARSNFDNLSMNKALDYAFEDDVELPEELRDYYYKKQDFEYNNHGKDWSKSKEYNKDTEDKLDKFFEAKGKIDDFANKLKGSKVGDALSTLITKVSNFIEIPIRKMTSFYDTISEGLYDALYDPQKGVIGSIKEFFTNPSAAFSKFGRFAGDKFFGRIGDDGKRHGGYISNFMNDTWDNMKGAGKYIAKTAKGFLRGPASFLSGYANGTRRITKTGIAAVSEGEMIIPAELNPYYRGSVNKRRQQRNELKAVRGFFGGFNKGTTSFDTSGAASMYDPDTNRVIYFDKNGQEIGSRPARDEDIIDAPRINFGSKVKGVLTEGRDRLFTGVTEALSIIFPDEKKFKDDIDTVKDKVDGYFKEIKGNTGAMGAGALIGSGVSILTGGIVGPILGAGIGAATGLVIKSEKVQKALFGEIDDNGDRTGGLLSKEVSNFMTKHLGKMGVGGLIGGAAGLFMGSPVLGSILGSTLGFVSSSEGAKEALFGKRFAKFDENGNVIGMERDGTGFISKELQDKIKKAMPNMAIGALGGVLAGPFGLAGNIVLGSALGYASSTKSFQEWLYGVEEGGKKVGGIINSFKTNMFDPIVGIFDKLAEEAKHAIRDSFHNLSKTVWKLMAERMRNTAIGRAVGKAGRGIYGIVSKPFKWASNGLQGFNNRLGRRALRKGYSIRDRQLKRNMTAEERIAYRDRLGMRNSGMYAGFDNILSGISSEEELTNLENLMNDYYNAPERAYKNISAGRTKLANALKNYGLDENSEIYKLAKKGKFDEANRLIDSLSIDSDKKASLRSQIEALRKGSNQYDQYTEYKKNIEKALGRKVKDSDLANMRDLIRDEKAGKSFVTEAEQEQKKLNDSVTGRIPNLLEDIIGILMKDPKTQERVKRNLGVPAKDSETNDSVSMEGEVQERNGEQYIFRNGKWQREEDVTRTEKVQDAIIEYLPFLDKLSKKSTTNDEDEKDKSDKNEEDKEKSKGFFKKILTKGLPLLGIAGATGLLNNFAADVGLAADDRKDKIFDSNGFEIKTDGKGNPILDENGNAINEHGQSVPMSEIQKRSHGLNFQKKIFENGIRGFLTKKDNILGRSVDFSKDFIKNNKTINKLINSSFGQSALKAGKEMLDSAATKLASARAIISENIDSLFKALKKVPIISKFADALESIGKSISLKTAGLKLSGELAQEVIKKGIVVITVALAIVDFIDGFNTASSILKVETPSTGEKITSGILRAVKNLIPVVGTLIPEKWIVEPTVEILFPLLGIDTSEFKARRQDFEEKVKEKGYSSVEDYNKLERNQKTIGEHIDEGWKNTTMKVKAGAKFISDNINWNAVSQAMQFGLYGGGSGFVSQLDSKYANMPMGGGNVAELGCAPASAVMALNQYSGNMANAVGLANRYQGTGGTDAAFFADYYARNGVAADYIDGTTSGGKSNIIRQIASGSPVVLMGRDGKNKSKSSSPFGPNNHYVVASGFDGAGNVIVNDPESKRSRKYSKRILNNVTLGVGMRGGRSNIIPFVGLQGRGSATYPPRVDAITKAVWSFFKNHGMTDEAVAGIMGNMQAESYVHPSTLQHKGTAKGIVQWEGDRFANMVAYANSKNKPWDDLESQLEFVLMEMKDPRVTFWKQNTDLGSYDNFIKLKDVWKATVDFEMAFERAGIKKHNVRYQYAKYYYEAFSGKTIDYDPPMSNTSISNNSTIVSSNSSSTGSAVSGAVTGLGILGTVYNAFNKLNSIFYGNGETDTFGDLSGSALTTAATAASVATPYNSKAYTGAANTIPWAGRTPVEIMDSMRGKVAYSLANDSHDPSSGKGNCASTVRWAIERLGGPNIGTYCGAQYENEALKDVWYNNGQPANMIPPGTQVGDLLYFRRNKSNRKDKVGHVELYYGDGKMIGHGGGKDGNTPGPTVKGISTSDLIRVKRLKDQLPLSYASSDGTTTSRKDYNNSGAGKVTMEAMGSGLLIKNNRTAPRLNDRSSRKVVRYTGAGTTDSVSTYRGPVMDKTTAGLLKVIIELVKTLVSNTNKVDNIYEVLVQIAGNKLDATQAALAATAIEKSRQESSDIDEGLNNLKATIDSILAS